MKLFLIEGYGAKGTDGQIRHFTVRAQSLEEAIDMIRRSAEGVGCARFDLVEDSAEFVAHRSAIIEQGEGSYLD